MRPRTEPMHPKLTRRALGAGLAAGAAALGIGQRARAAVPAIDPDLRDAALRGLALAGYRGDPVTAEAARAAAERLAVTDPEGALLYRLYRALDVRPAQYWQGGGLPDAAAPDLTLLHGAIGACQPVAFGYTDLSDNVTQRKVLPLALVHPPQGVKLLAWCELAGDYRQFFVRAMRDLTAHPDDFAATRLSLLEGLVEKEGA